MEKRPLVFRLMFIFLVLFSFTSIAIFKLYDLQVVHAEQYKQTADQKLSANTAIYAARGEIVDRNGVKLISNSISFEVSFNKALWSTENQNEIILELVNLFIENDEEYNDTLPIEIGDAGLVFSDNTTKLFSFLESKKAGDSVITASQILDFLVTRYSINEDYTTEEKLLISGVRYQMEQDVFSTVTDFAFGQTVNQEIIEIIEEGSNFYQGVNILLKPVREYQTTYAAHILGTVGPIYAEEYAEYKANGYGMNDTVGKSGMEKALEEYIRAIDGKEASILVSDGEIIATGDEVSPIPGNNAVLTIDLELQMVAEHSLANTLESIKENAIATNADEGQDVEGGAVVVLDVNTGEVLALASYPTYNLETFNADYTELSTNPLKPMINRATSGLYAPGSTYKMVVAIAGLEEGIVTPTTKILDQGIYMYYAPSYTPRCLVYSRYGYTHGWINVEDALKVSCNYYFYEVGRLLTGATQEEYAKMFGLGSKTGIELEGEYSGTVAGPTSREAKGQTWYPGDSLAAAIGQSDHLYTPVQLANYIATLANGGTLNQVHLLKSVESYDYTETIFENNLEPVQVTEISESSLAAVFKGMNNVVNEGGTASSVFKDYEIEIAAKTGSVQVGTGSSNGVFVSFAPLDNPEIAVAVVGEKVSSGGNLASVVRDIYDEYFGLNELRETELLEGEQ